MLLGLMVEIRIVKHSDGFFVGGIVHKRLSRESHRFGDDECSLRRGVPSRSIVQVRVDGHRAPVAVPEKPSDRGQSDAVDEGV